MSARRATVRAQRAGGLWPAISEGIPTSVAGIRIRLARPEDDAAVRRYIIQATEDQNVNDVTKPVPIVCPTIRAGLETGRDGFLERLARALVELDPDAPESWVMVAFSLVAVNEDDEVVGSVTVSPPYTYLDGILRGRTDEETKMLMLQAQFGLSKVTAVAVREDLRGHGIGADLVNTALQVLRRCGMGLIVFGYCLPERTAFYRRLGFKISPLGQPIDLYLALGIHALISTPDHHVFSIERASR